MRGFPAFACLFAAARLLVGQEGEAVIRDAMKQIGPTNGALGKKLAAKDASAAEDAKKLQSLFAGTRSFWEARKADDAVQFAASASGVYEKVFALIGEGKWDDAAAEQKKVGANCMGCHTAHREKAPDGSWKIK